MPRLLCSVHSLLCECTVVFMLFISLRYMSWMAALMTEPGL